MDRRLWLYFAYYIPKDWINSYEISRGTVLMGSNALCKIFGIDSVCVRCHDGILMTIIEVHHVPDLKKNLIFFGTLDNKGYK